MVEGPGHVPLDQIEFNVKNQLKCEQFLTEMELMVL